MSQRFPSLPFRPLALLALATLLLAAGGCTQKSAPRAPRSSVTVAPAERRDMPVYLIASGTVDPIESASIGSQVGGMVTRIAFREGDDVRAGQALVELDSRPFRARARAGLRGTRAIARRPPSRAPRPRAAQLHAQQLLSQADFDAKQAAAEALAAAVAADSAAVQRAKLDLEYATIRSPIAGRAGEVKVHVGDYVKAATSEPLVTVNHVDPIDALHAAGGRRGRRPPPSHRGHARVRAPRRGRLDRARGPARVRGQRRGSGDRRLRAQGPVRERRRPAVARRVRRGAPRTRTPEGRRGRALGRGERRPEGHVRLRARRRLHGVAAPGQGGALGRRLRRDRRRPAAR